MGVKTYLKNRNSYSILCNFKEIFTHNDTITCNGTAVLKIVIFGPTTKSPPGCAMSHLVRALHYNLMKRAVFLLSVCSCVTALNNGVGITPPMGFNTYQSPWPFQGGYAEAIADALTTTGLKDLGATNLELSSLNPLRLNNA